MVNFSDISTADKVLYCIIFMALLSILTISIIFYIVAWKQNLRYVKMEVRRAGNDSERRHWERELKMVYWSIIPGITVRRLKKLRRFFQKNKSKR